MNKAIKRISSVLLLLALVTGGCVESLVDNSSTGKPTITLISPAKGDTIQLKDNFVTYEAADVSGGPGLANYELFINGEPIGIVSQNEDGSNPSIYLDVDPSLLNTRISYFITVYNADGTYKSSDAIDNIYVVYSNKPPRRPGNLTLTKFNTNSINLFWEDSSFNEIGFELWKKIRDNGEWAKYKTLDSSTISINEYGLSDQINYYYKLRAFNEFGYSEFSEEVNTFVSGGILSATAVGATSVYLSWLDNSTNELGYQIQRKLSNADDFQPIGNVGPNINEFTDEGLTANTSYDYRIAAFTSTSVGEWSNVATVTTYRIDIPGPSNLVATFDPSTKNVIVSWDDNTMFETGTKVERMIQGGNFEVIGSTGADFHTYTDQKPPAPYIYYYRARHNTTEGFMTAYSNVDTAYVPSLAPTAPTNLRLFVSNPPYDYGIVWSDNSDDEEEFQLWMKEGKDGTYALFETYLTNQTAALIDVPDASKIYYFKLRAIKGGLFSESGEVNTASGTAGFTLEAYEIGANYIILQWPDSFDDEVAYSLVRKFSWETWADDRSQEIALVGPFDGGSVRVTDDGLQASTVYNYRVRAVYTSGYSDYSNEITVTTSWQ
ncbi:MAG: fibronectin type III domain-containing protein [bacterium]